MTGRSIRARVVLALAGPLAAALIAGTVALAVLFSTGRVRDLDQQTLAEAQALVAVAATGQLPAVLPVPDGSPLLGQLLAADGSVLAATPSASRVQPLLSGRALTRRVDTDERSSYAGVPLRVRVVPVTVAGHPAYAVVAAPLTDVRNALRALRVVLLVVVPLLLLGVLGVAWWVTGRALRPVERLRSAAAAQTADPGATPAAPLPVPPGDDEVARLAGTLNQLLTDLRRLVAREQAFVADAAHELRSPLASLRVQVDVARAHPQQVELPALLADLDSDLSRLSRLTEDLLALSRVEQGPAVRRPVDLQQLAGADGRPAPVLGDPDALRRLVDNLLDNAQRHARRVAVTTSVAAGWAVLDVDDDGPGIAEADRERVFERWVRLDEARDRAAGGTGLGLALVRAVARAHGGDVAVSDSPLGGARFRVRLPAAAEGRSDSA